MVLKCLFVKKFIINIVKFQYILELDLQLQRVTSVRFHSRLLHRYIVIFQKPFSYLAMDSKVYILCVSASLLSKNPDLP